eukprot:scaffold31185_cov27-Tisochrysis_lutea.AAC.1
MVVKFQTFDDKAKELPQASSRSMASAFKDVTAHLVVRNYKFEMKDYVTINSLAKALEHQGFIFLKGNQERTKVLTKEGIIVTQGKKEVYHCYVAPRSGNFSTFDFPRKILLNVNGNPWPHHDDRTHPSHRRDRKRQSRGTGRTAGGIL